MKSQHDNPIEVFKRLQRISDHVQGIVRMVERNEPCDEIPLRISVVQVALSRLIP